MADFDATLYFLDEREIEYLHGRSGANTSRICARNIVAALLDIFEAQTDPDIRGEIIDNLQTVMLSSCSPRATFRGVANLLREAHTALERAALVTSVAAASALAQLAERLSAPDALSQLLQALDETPTLPPQEELADLFDQLRPAGVGDGLHLDGEDRRTQKLRPLLEGAAGRLAGANTSELVRLIQVAGARSLVRGDSPRGRAQDPGGRARAEQSSR